MNIRCEHTKVAQVSLFCPWIEVPELRKTPSYQAAVVLAGGATRTECKGEWVNPFTHMVEEDYNTRLDFYVQEEMLGELLTLVDSMAHHLVEGGEKEVLVIISQGGLVTTYKFHRN